MKKLLFLFTSFIVVSISCFAANPPDITDYLSVRYVKLNYSGAVYRVDLKEVVFVAHNVHDHLGTQFGRGAGWGTNHYWVMFKNGTWLAVDPAADAHGKWDNYQNFLKQNPKFLSIP